LKDEKRVKVAEIAQRAITEGRIGDPELYDYLRMVCHNFEIGRTISIGCFAERIFELKRTQRAGWVIRGVKDSESVAAHMYGTYVIGLLYLPQTDPNPEYTKSKILDMLLVHDLGEAFTGDIPEGSKTQEQREEEARWIG
jgi:HD domain